MEFKKVRETAAFQALVNASELKYKENHQDYGTFKPGDKCPSCGAICHDDSTYIDTGVGLSQVNYVMSCPFCKTQGVNTGANIIWFDGEGYAIDSNGKRIFGGDKIK